VNVFYFLYWVNPNLKAEKHPMKVSVSSEFKKIAGQAITSIILFVFTYLALVALAAALMAASVYLGILIILLKPSFITLALGLGLAGMGVFVLFFLVKFIFKKHVTDRSHLVEIHREQHPELFAMIQSIVDKVQTSFPKKVYLSADVNAAVFYDSSFWSMFLPIRKNLQIGVGLINAVTVAEFEAILAHEFGHFSQRSMKVGSYVYNVNQVIYNMLYDNSGYQSVISKWASVSEWFSIFVKIGIYIIMGIQWVLKKLYDAVNLNYMKLSREMEFHADEVAANVSGSKPLATSLLRLDLANHSYQSVINFYNEKIAASVKTDNIYPQQKYVLGFLGKEDKLSFENNLPNVTVNHLSRYNKSKLTISDQWASHPASEDRVRKLEKLNISTINHDNRPAGRLFHEIAAVEKQLTEKLFSGIKYEKEASNTDVENFVQEFTKEYESATFDPLFNGYYNGKHPNHFDIEETRKEIGAVNDIEQLFSDDAVDMVYTSTSMERDIETLKLIAGENHSIKSFDYNGNKYTPQDCNTVLSLVEKELKETKEKILKNDKAIFIYFYNRAQNAGKDGELKQLYSSYFALDRFTDEMIEKMQPVREGIQFTFEETSYDLIHIAMDRLSSLETDFKERFKQILNRSDYQSQITTEMRDNFTKYIAFEGKYFNGVAYDSESLSLLYNAINHFQAILSGGFLKKKKELLNYQAQLEKDAEASWSSRKVS
jgi:Zn-dependent protease with chaperone function